VSLVQVALGIVLIWMATREGRPARRLPRGVVRAALAGAGFMVVAVSFVAVSESPTQGAHGMGAWRGWVGLFFWGCLGGPRHSSRWRRGSIHGSCPRGQRWPAGSMARARR